MASISISDGEIIDGEVVSTTEIVWVEEAELPDESVAVQVTSVSPSGKTSGASLVIVATSTRSETRTPIKSTIFSSIWIASIIRSEGAEIVGNVVSTIVMIWVFEIEFP